MNRRTFLCGLTLGPLAAPLAAGAQQPKIPKIGVLLLADLELVQPLFREGLRDVGLIEGQNIHAWK